MPIVYLDYNIIATAAGLPSGPSSASWRGAINALSGAGYSFALSAWHAYELANSNNQQHVDACCEFIEAVRPLWLSNSLFVKCDEMTRFLNCISGNADYHIRVFNPSIAQMWTTYGGVFKFGETFRNSVHELRIAHGALAQIDYAAAKTPDAIQTARAALDDGRFAATQHIVDQEYFSSLIRPPNPSALDCVLQNLKQVLSMCPTIAVEDELTRIRVVDGFKPTDSAAADLQHAMVALAYCDHFVSNDKTLHEHCRQVTKKLGLPCRVHRNPTAIIH